MAVMRFKINSLEEKKVPPGRLAATCSAAAAAVQQQHKGEMGTSSFAHPLPAHSTTSKAATLLSHRHVADQQRKLTGRLHATHRTVRGRRCDW
jgi:hypothetical protein